MRTLIEGYKQESKLFLLAGKNGGGILGTFYSEPEANLVHNCSGEGDFSWCRNFTGIF